MKRTITTLFVSLMLIVSAFAQDTLFVKNSDESPAWEGRTAYTNLQDAIDAAQSGDMIWVEEGIYYPTRTFNNSNDVRCKSFVMKENVTLYGGFDGTETDIEERSMMETVLSGDVANTPDVETDNAYHVVYCNGISNVVLDGFTVTGGYANRTGYLDDQDGAGVYMGANGQLRNCYITDNAAMRNGGGVWVPSTAVLIDCYFSENSVFAANSGGGAAYFDNRPGTVNAPTAAVNCYFEENHCSATNAITGSNRFGGGAVNAGQNTHFEGCIFSLNSCTNPGGAVICSSSCEFEACAFFLNRGTNGGAIYGGSNSNLLASNCLFANNEATANGGAVYYTGAICRAINSTFVNNAAATGCAVYGSSTFTVFNSIVWNNGTVPENQLAGASDVTCMYTAIQGVLASGEGNLNVTTEDIAFTEPCTLIGIPENEEDLELVFETDYYIESQSVCKDAGSTNTLYLSGYHFPEEDLYGEERIVGSAIDLGCFENLCANIAPEYTWTVVDTLYNPDEPGTGSVGIAFTITNYNEDYTYFLTAGASIMMDGNTITVVFDFPGSYTYTISYTDGECGAETEVTITIDSLFAPVGIVENGAGTLSLYPNPATTSLTVETESPIREITVYDIAGHAVMVETCHGASLEQVINTTSLSEGIYLLNVVTDRGVQTSRFIKK
jgi:hypothetical protein